VAVRLVGTLNSGVGWRGACAAYPSLKGGSDLFPRFSLLLLLRRDGWERTLGTRFRRNDCETTHIFAQVKNGQAVKREVWSEGENGE